MRDSTDIIEDIARLQSSLSDSYAATEEEKTDTRPFDKVDDGEDPFVAISISVQEEIAKLNEEYEKAVLAEAEAHIEEVKARRIPGSPTLPSDAKFDRPAADISQELSQPSPVSWWRRVWMFLAALIGRFRNG